MIDIAQLSRQSIDRFVELTVVMKKIACRYNMDILVRYSDRPMSTSFLPIYHLVIKESNNER